MRGMKKRIYLLSVIVCCNLSTVCAQTYLPLNYRDFLERVYTGNLEYAAEKLNIDIAEAEIQAAKVFNDPQLGIEYANNQEPKLKMGYGVSFELSKTVSLGKRRVGIDLARSESELTAALLEDYFRNLRVEATLSYLEALKQYRLYEVKKDAYQNVSQLAASDSVRFALGTIREVDAIQSRLEAGMLYNELRQAGAELENTFQALSALTGMFLQDTFYIPQGNLQKPMREFVPGWLLETALTNRTDLQAALKQVEVARREVKVARRERNADIDLSLGISKNARVRNEEAPAPPFTGVTVGVGIPLKFSNFYKGEVKAARFREEQFQMRYKQAQLEVRTEVMQAYRQYRSLGSQLEAYENGLLERAGQVMEGKVYSYTRGESSLLEVLDAQRTYDEVRSQYIETCFQLAAALVELERSVGIWDIEM